MIRHLIFQQRVCKFAGRPLQITRAQWAGMLRGGLRKAGGWRDRGQGLKCQGCFERLEGPAEEGLQAGWGSAVLRAGGPSVVVIGGGPHKGLGACRLAGHEEVQVWNNEDWFEGGLIQLAGPTHRGLQASRLPRQRADLEHFVRRNRKIVGASSWLARDNSMSRRLHD